jgi:FAD linked oxidases, C-terminal domain
MEPVRILILNNPRPKSPPKTPDQTNPAEASDQILPSGTGEHGIGIGKKEFLIEELGEGTVELMKTIKKVVDPYNLFNPGKVSFPIFSVSDNGDTLIFAQPALSRSTQGLVSLAAV